MAVRIARRSISHEGRAEYIGRSNGNEKGKRCQQRPVGLAHFFSLVVHEPFPLQDGLPHSEK